MADKPHVSVSLVCVAFAICALNTHDSQCSTSVPSKPQVDDENVVPGVSQCFSIGRVAESLRL